jgi:hypothetical protein
MSDADTREIDWSLTTWEGARREQLRRWAALPLERIVLALEEMQELADWLCPGAAKADAPPAHNDGGSAADAA